MPGNLWSDTVIANPVDNCAVQRWNGPPDHQTEQTIPTNPFWRVAGWNGKSCYVLGGLAGEPVVPNPVTPMPHAHLSSKLLPCLGQYGNDAY
jgi:hypothetical protein